MSKNLQGIFQIKNDDGIWRDFVREQVKDHDEARRFMKTLQSYESKPFRVRIEDWDTREPNVFIGAWTKEMLSPADRQNGIFYKE